MSKQRYVQDSFWTDPYIETLDPSEKLLFLYFITNPLCNVAGIYEIRNNRVAYETGFDKDMVQKIKDRFIKDGKLLCKNDWILIVNFAKNQSPNPNVLLGMQRIINELPDEVKALKGFERLSHFTLLNLTIPNLTKRKAESIPEVEVSFSEAIAPQDNQQIPQLIKEFESINPACKKFYGNKTQRTACKDLIDTYGYDRVVLVIQKTLPKTNLMEFFPKITTPLQLFDKWATLEAKVGEHQLKKSIKNNNVAF
jgi:hypothetical protein